MSRNAGVKLFVECHATRSSHFSPQPWLCVFSSKIISMRDSLDVECLCRIEKEKNALQAEGDDLSVSLETLQKQKVFL